MKSIRILNNTCGRGRLPCKDGHCIFWRYGCDGYADCRDGSDEAVELCGENPCHGRIYCTNINRCIPPHWCCPRPSSVRDGIYACDMWQRKLCCSRQRALSRDDWFEKLPSNVRINNPGFNGRTQQPLPTLSSKDGYQRRGRPTLPVIGALVLVTLLALVGMFAFHRWRVHKSSRRRDQRVRSRNHHRCIRGSARARPNGSHGGITARPCLETPVQRTLQAQCPNSSREGHPNTFRTVGTCRAVPTGTMFARLQFLEHNDFLPHAGDDSPPPPYSDLEKSNDGPLRCTDLSVNSTDNDGLPSYNSAMQQQMAANGSREMRI